MRTPPEAHGPQDDEGGPAHCPWIPAGTPCPDVQVWAVTEWVQTSLGHGNACCRLEGGTAITNELIEGIWTLLLSAYPEVTPVFRGTQIDLVIHGRTPHDDSGAVSLIEHDRAVFLLVRTTAQYAKALERWRL